MDFPDLTSIRTDYARAGLDERDAHPSPFVQAKIWLDEAIAAKHPEPTAMTVATADPSGATSARVVLLKGLDERGFAFYTNYDGAKGQTIAQNPQVAANFFWMLLERQVKVVGVAEKTTREESEAYFRSRPRGSQLGAWTSKQSSVIPNRAHLEAALAAVTARFEGGDVPCPPHWGGYRIVPTEIEFWQGRPSRLHDRLRYTRIGDAAWRIDRLAP